MHCIHRLFLLSLYNNLRLGAGDVRNRNKLKYTSTYTINESGICKLINYDLKMFFGLTTKKNMFLFDNLYVFQRGRRYPIICNIVLIGYNISCLHITVVTPGKQLWKASKRSKSSWMIETHNNLGFVCPIASKDWLPVGWADEISYRCDGHEGGVSKCCGIHQNMNMTDTSHGHVVQPGCIQLWRFLVLMDNDFPRWKSGINKEKWFSHYKFFLHRSAVRFLQIYRRIARNGLPDGQPVYLDTSVENKLKKNPKNTKQRYEIIKTVMSNINFKCTV